MNETHVIKTTESVEETLTLGRLLGVALKGGETLELQSDIGGGKTTFMKGLAKGMGFEETLQSPTFIVGATYEQAAGPQLHHYDFYRIHDAGIMRDQLAESLGMPTVVTAVEWSDVVKDVLPADAVRIIIRNDMNKETHRHFDIRVPKRFGYLIEAIGT